MFLLELWNYLPQLASKLNKINFENGFSELACQPTCHIKRVWIKGLHSPDQSHVTQCNSMTPFWLQNNMIVYFTSSLNFRRWLRWSQLPHSWGDALQPMNMATMLKWKWLFQHIMYFFTAHALSTGAVLDYKFRIKATPLDQVVRLQSKNEYKSAFYKMSLHVLNFL